MRQRARTEAGPESGARYLILLRPSRLVGKMEIIPVPTQGYRGATELLCVRL